MPEDIIEESGVQEEEISVSAEVQEQNPSDDNLDDIVEDDLEDIPEDELEGISEDELEDILEDDLSVSGNDIDYDYVQDMINRSVSENNALYLTEDYTVVSDLEEFETSTILVDRYQYAILEKLEFMQYAQAIVIALLFLLLFMRYKK